MRIVIIGAGFGGMGAAIRLLRAGFDDVTLLERGPDVGGVWRDNTYPGCACDVQSQLYGLSFAQNPSWTRAYARQPEILAYLSDLADSAGLRARVRFDHNVTAASWLEGRWRITTSHGDLDADVLIAAQGALADAAMPPIVGLSTFAGHVMHTSRWSDAVALDGRRVAVVGTGASAIQLIPQIQPRVGHLTVFQRTAAWVLPRNDRPVATTMRAMYRRFPVTQRLARALIAAQRALLLVFFVSLRAQPLLRRIALQHLKRSVPDASLRAKLTPPYAVGCKRILASDDFLPAMGKQNVTLVTDAVVRVTERGVVDATGTLHELDVIICGTGFAVTDQPLARVLRGSDGRSLAQTWANAMHAHVGTTVHGFPNLFLVLGPNTGLGHSSVVAMMEVQFDHIVQALEHMRAHNIASLQPRLAAQHAFASEVDRKMRGTVWTAGGCASWYLDATGRNSTLWPRSISAFRRRAARFVVDDYE